MTPAVQTLIEVLGQTAVNVIRYLASREGHDPDAACALACEHPEVKMLAARRAAYIRETGKEPPE